MPTDSKYRSLNLLEPSGAWVDQYGDCFTFTFTFTRYIQMHLFMLSRSLSTSRMQGEIRGMAQKSREHKTFNGMPMFRSKLKSARHLKTGPIGCPETSVEKTTRLRWITSQKSEDLIYTATETGNHANCFTVLLSISQQFTTKSF